MAFIISQSRISKKYVLTLYHSIFNEVGKRWSSKYFITTPIFYVNADPHMGHLYTALIADATARFQKLKNPDIKCRLMVGTDEHGLKVSQSAKEAKINVSEYCDKISERYRKLFNLYKIEADDFLRTTEERHLKTVTALWNKLLSKDLIYKDRYSGWYCVSDEVFVSEAFLDPKPEDENGLRFTLNEMKPCHFMDEDNYKFKLSLFQKDLLHWVNSGDIIKPKVFREQLCQWIEDVEVMKDISVSRPSTRVPWGVPVPGDSSQTIYVWLDALSSYLCSNGYPHSNFKWPPDLQIIGKDILKFHGVFWPAFLLAADLEPPKCIFCHSHWVRFGEKMSKSKGNVVNPFEQSDVYTSDGFRYFLLREGVAHNDGNFTHEKATFILNSELAHSLGNLLSRCTSVKINRGQIFPAYSEESYQKYCQKNGENLINSLKELPEKVINHFEELNFYKGIDSIIATLHLANKFVHESEPWSRGIKDDKLHFVLHLTMESLRVCGILLQPIIPDISKTLLNKLSVDERKRNLKDIRPFSWECEPTTEKLMSGNIILFQNLRF